MLGTRSCDLSVEHAVKALDALAHLPQESTSCIVKSSTGRPTVGRRRGFTRETLPRS
jgi:hypothetical protein